jgi:hypothetical protein
MTARRTLDFKGFLLVLCSAGWEQCVWRTTAGWCPQWPARQPAVCALSHRWAYNTKLSAVRPAACHAGFLLEAVSASPLSAFALTSAACGPAGSHGGSGSRGSMGPTPTPTPPPRTPPLGHAHSLGAPGSGGHSQHSQLAANAAIAAALQVGTCRVPLLRALLRACS